MIPESEIGARHADGASNAVSEHYLTRLPEQLAHGPGVFEVSAKIDPGTIAVRMDHHRVSRVYRLIPGFEYLFRPSLILTKLHLRKRNLFPYSSAQHRTRVGKEMIQGRIALIVRIIHDRLDARLGPAVYLKLDNTVPLHRVTTRTRLVAAVSASDKRVVL